MKTKKIVKISLDIVMTAVMLILMDLNITGLKLHELIGIGIFLLFIIHKAFNLSWIKAMSCNLFNPKVKVKAKFMYCLDVILLISVTANVISGILISRHIFTGIEADNIRLMSVLHHFFAWWSLIFIVLHISMHMGAAVNYASRKLKAKINGKRVSALVGICFVMLSFLGVFNLSNRNISRYILPDFSSTLNSTEIVKNHRHENQDQNQNGYYYNYHDENDDINDYYIPDSDDKSDSSVDNNQSGSDPTLEEYLSGFSCSACGHHCPLLSIRCGRGQEQLNEKINEYNATYAGQNSSY